MSRSLYKLLRFHIRPSRVLVSKRIRSRHGAGFLRRIWTCHQYWSRVRTRRTIAPGCDLPLQGSGFSGQRSPGLRSRCSLTLGCIVLPLRGIEPTTGTPCSSYAGGASWALSVRRSRCSLTLGCIIWPLRGIEPTTGTPPFLIRGRGIMGVAGRRSRCSLTLGSY